MTDFERAGGGALTWDYSAKGDFDMVFDVALQVDHWLDACPYCPSEQGSTIWTVHGITHQARIH